MVRVGDIYFINKDVRVFRNRLAWLDTRIAAREQAGTPNAPGAGFDRGERSALKRLISQIEEKGVSCDERGSINPRQDPRADPNVRTDAKERYEWA